MASIGQFLMGTKEGFQQKSNFDPRQMQLQEQLMNAIQGQGAGGAFGGSADYYRNLMNDDSSDYQAFAAPEMRNYRENVIPELSEQFAGMGAGNLSSSGFRNAAAGAGADLSERLGKIRADLRQRGAEGLANISKMGLTPYLQNIITPPTPGLLEMLSVPVGAALGGPAGTAAGAAVGGLLGKYGRLTPASPTNTSKGSVIPQEVPNLRKMR